MATLQVSSTNYQDNQWPLPTSLTTPDTSDSDSSKTAANFGTVIQNLENTGAISSNNFSMLQALQKSATTAKSSGSSGELVQSLLSVTKGNNDLSMLQALSFGSNSNSGVANLLQSLQQQTAQNNETAMLKALQNVSATKSKDANQQDIIDTLTRPTDNSTDQASLLQSPQSSDSGA